MARYGGPYKGRRRVWAAAFAGLPWTRGAALHRIAPMPTVTVLYFAALRERRGVSSETLSVEEGTTLGGLYAQLFDGAPEAALPVAFARNQGYADATDLLDDGDEVAFLPPLGGG